MNSGKIPNSGKSRNRIKSGYRGSRGNSEKFEKSGNPGKSRNSVKSGKMTNSGKSRNRINSGYRGNRGNSEKSGKFGEIGEFGEIMENYEIVFISVKQKPILH